MEWECLVDGDNYHEYVCHCVVWNVNPLVLNNMGLDARKPVFKVLQITQAQTSLRIRTVRSACASAQSDQRLCYLLFGKNHM